VTDNELYSNKYKKKEFKDEKNDFAGRFSGFHVCGFQFVHKYQLNEQV